MAGNDHTKELSNHLFLGVWVKKKRFLPSSRPKMVPKRAQIRKIHHRTKKHLIIYFADFRSNFLEMGTTFDLLSALKHLVPKKTKKVNNLRRNRRETKNKNYLLPLFEVRCLLPQNAFHTTIQA